MKTLKYAAYLILLVILFVGAVSLFLFFYFSRSLPTIEQISTRQINQSTKIYDRTGIVLLYEISSGEDRTVVPLENIPKYLKDATIVTEDENFYNEPAFDWAGILRAILVDLLHGQILQGGSTITQQLAKNAFLTPERTIIRKIKEFILAVQLNRHYSKDQILTLYLNEIPYGSTAYGVEAASEAYFAKPVQDLNLAESSIVAAITKAPTYYSPWGSHLKELLTRQKLILKKMLGLGKISQKEFTDAAQFKLVFAPRGRGIKAPHFVLAVEDYLVQKYGENVVRRGGLRVTTTLDWNLEQVAEKIVADGAAQNDTLYNGRNAALVAENPKTGQILALVGSRDYFSKASLPEGCTPGANCQFEPSFNVALQGLRQPGSALKPFVYLTAFQKGYAPDTVVFDVQTEFAANNPSCPPVPDPTNDNKECFHPENFDGQYRGPVSMRQALAQSINVPAVKVLYLAGLENSVKNAYNFGLGTLTSPNLYGLSLVLGGGAVRLIDLVGAYSALAEDGVRHEQTLVLEVKDAGGNLLESFADTNKRVADPEPVRLVNNILSDTDARSGLFQNSLALTTFPEHDVALKTGTSNDYHDAWSIGYTPSLVAGVWAGNNDNSPMQKHGSSILAAVPIWHNFMAEAIKSLPLETFNRPDQPIPQKPILAGNYLNNKQIHSILYYVDKKNPTGPPPINPADDPQFNNWESSVLAWAEKNIPDFQDYNKTVPQNENVSSSVAAASPPQTKIERPAAGSYTAKQINILAKITSATFLSTIKIYWNNQVIQTFSLGSTTNYDLNWSFSPTNIAPQNLLEIEAVDQNNLQGKSGVVVYSN